MSKKILFLSMVTVLTAFVSCKNKEAAAPAETTPTPETVAPAVSGSYNMDSTATKILWVGSKPTGKHNGTIAVKSGNITVENGAIKSGSFIIDMNSINVLDLAGKDKKALESHLKGTDKAKADDFFNTPKYPTGKFEITKTTGLANDSTANTLIYGNLALKDITKEVSFKANVNITDNAVTVNAKPFSINRTDWNIKYGSKTFFNDLKDKFIEDMFSLEIMLSAKK